MSTGRRIGSARPRRRRAVRAVSSVKFCRFSVKALPVHPPARKANHTVIPCIFEVFGGFEEPVCNLLNNWAARARGKTPPGEEPPWSARNYVPYWSQLISKEAQRGAAEEILSRVREEAGAREAARARGE